MRGGVTKLLHLLSAAKTRVGKPRRAGPAAACSDVPEAAAGGVHRGGAGVSDIFHVSTESRGLQEEGGKTNFDLFQA